MKGLYAVLAGVAGLVASFGAVAQSFSAITSQDAANLLGSDATGSETGLYELAALVPVGLGVCMGIVIAFATYALVRKFLMRSRG